MLSSISLLADHGEGGLGYLSFGFYCEAIERWS